MSDLFYKARKEFDYDGMKEKDMFRRIDFAVMDHSADQHHFKEFSRNFTHFTGTKTRKRSTGLSGMDCFRCSVARETTSFFPAFVIMAASEERRAIQ